MIRTIISRPRIGGKTTLALQWMRENPEAICVVFSHDEAERLARESGLDKKRFVSVQSNLKGRFPRGTVLAVDNLDIVLSMLLGAEVQFATLTRDEDS